MQPSTVKKPGGRRADAPPPEFRFYTEFQSHEPEFDYLKSLEIEEKVNKVKWLKSTNSARLVLTTNGESTQDILQTGYSFLSGHFSFRFHVTFHPLSPCRQNC